MERPGILGLLSQAGRAWLLERVVLFGWVLHAGATNIAVIVVVRAGSDDGKLLGSLGSTCGAFDPQLVERDLGMSRARPGCSIHIVGVRQIPCVGRVRAMVQLGHGRTPIPRARRAQDW